MWVEVSAILQKLSKLQGASLELSPPLLHSYIVKGVTVPVTHPVPTKFVVDSGCIILWINYGLK